MRGIFQYASLNSHIDSSVCRVSQGKYCPNPIASHHYPVNIKSGPVSICKMVICWYPVVHTVQCWLRELQTSSKYLTHLWLIAVRVLVVSI